MLAERRDARLIIAGGESLLDHSAYQSEFVAQLARMGEGAGAVVCTGTLADADMPSSIASRRRLFSHRSRRGSAFAYWRRWRAESRYLGENDVLWCDPLTPTSIAAAMRAALREDVAAAARVCGPALTARFDWRGVALRHLPLYYRLREPAHV